MDQSKELSVSEISGRFEKIYTGVIGDTLDQMGYRNQILPPDINPVSEFGTIAGPAFTGLGEDHKNPEEEDSAIRLEMLEALTPGCITIWQTGGSRQCAHWGELMSVAAIENGCKGAVVDGGTRDLNLIKDAGFPVFCKFTNPASSIGRWSIKAYQVPIVIGNTEICPGDYIIADIDGVVVVPEKIIMEVLEISEETTAKENEMRRELKEEIKSPTYIPNTEYFNYRGLP